MFASVKKIDLRNFNSRFSLKKSELNNLSKSKGHAKDCYFGLNIPSNLKLT